MENEVLKAIRERRSIRRFTSERPTREQLDTILDAGTWAASGHSKQSAFIVAVTSDEVNARLRQMNAEAWGTDTDPYYGAPVIVLVFAPEDNENGVKDGSLCLGNMMLAAHSIGLASCWINREDAMFRTEEGRQMMARWGLPEGLMGVGALALGFAASHPRRVVPRKEGYVRVVE